MKTFIALTIPVLLLACTAARARAQSRCLEVEKIQTSHRVLYPEGTMNVHVRLKTSHCVLANAFGAGTTTALLVEPRPGLESTIGSLTYSEFENQLSSLDTPQAHVLEATILVRAGQVGPGAYDIPAFLNYQAVDEKGAVRNESLQFAIPVVIETSSRPLLSNEHTGSREGFAVTGEVVLGILLWPVWVVKCLIAGDCSNC